MFSVRWFHLFGNFGDLFTALSLKDQFHAFGFQQGDVLEQQRVFGLGENPVKILRFRASRVTRMGNRP
jgi:hypothetical protein